ncbi:MAG: TetR/AcrR family transcriptional regulator [bacterium]|nr:TetR/AcrR family transcriptional regulator [bacterium]
MGNSEITRPQILESAKKEFLEKGYKDAALRKIVKQVGLTTGAFYGYYSSKEEVFDALVGKTAKRFLAWHCEVYRRFEEKQLGMGKKAFEMFQKELGLRMLEYIYQEYEAFRLLFCCSKGSSYENFMEQLVEVQADFLLRWVKNMEQQGYHLRIQMDEKLAHVIAVQNFQAVYEMIALRFSKKQAIAYIYSIYQIQYYGWSGNIELWEAETGT